MLPSQRHKQLLDWLSTQEMATINEIAQRFDISIETVRRDLNALDTLGKIEKVYGGAKLAIAPPTEPSIATRMQVRAPLKDVIAKKAATLIEEGDCIFIDSGTTPLFLAQYLATHFRQLTVVTNSIHVVNCLMSTSFEVLIIGGKVRSSEGSTVSYDNLFQADQLNIQKGFFSCGGISIDRGVSDYDLSEINTRRMVMKQVKQLYLLADSSKLDGDVLLKVDDLSAFNAIVTDDHIGEDQVKRYRHWLVTPQK